MYSRKTHFKSLLNQYVEVDIIAQYTVLFDLIQKIYHKHSGIRVNFLQYNFVIRQFNILLGKKELNCNFPSTLSLENYNSHLIIWKKMAEELQWPICGCSFDQKKNTLKFLHLQDKYINNLFPYHIKQSIHQYQHDNICCLQY